MNTLDFKIVTQERVVYHDDIEQVTIPTKDGEITVLPRHTPLVSMLTAGSLMVKKKDGKHYLSVSSGVVEVRPNSQVVILAKTAEPAEDIDVERAEAAKKRAEEMLEEKRDVSGVEFGRIQELFEKEQARERVGRRHRDLNVKK